MFNLKKINKEKVVNEFLEKYCAEYGIKSEIGLTKDMKKLCLEMYYFGFMDGMYNAQDHVDSLFDALQKTLPEVD